MAWDPNTCQNHGDALLGWIIFAIIIAIAAFVGWANDPSFYAGLDY